MYSKPMRLKDKISMHIPVHAVCKEKSDLFGVEVELEGQNIFPPSAMVSDYWQIHNEPSLRKLGPGDQSAEYVFIHPYDLKTTEKAVRKLFEFLTRPGCKVHDSYRTSIHVHLNMANEEFRTVYNFIVLSLILDELLVSQNGEHRIGNNFTLRAKDAMGQIVSLIDSIENGNGFFGVAHNDRYSSINFASLTKFGSAEFRSLECTTHEGRLMHWIGTLQAIKAWSRSFKNPTEVIQRFSMMGPKDFLIEALGPFSSKYRAVPEYKEMMFNGMRIAQDIAYCSEWKEADQDFKLRPGTIYKIPKYYNNFNDIAEPPNYDEPVDL